MEVLQWLTIKLTEHVSLLSSLALLLVPDFILIKAASLLAKSLMGGKQNAEAWNENMVAIVGTGSSMYAFDSFLSIVLLRQSAPSPTRTSSSSISTLWPSVRSACLSL